MSLNNQIHPKLIESYVLPLKSNTEPNPIGNQTLIGMARFRDFIQENETNLDDFNLLEIPDYKRIRIVGQGSFGIAVLYQKKHDASFVVIKQINLTDLASLEREMAMNEVEIFSKLHHPNIISYYDSFIRNETLLIEMEFADGGTLAHLIADREPNERIPERQVLIIFEQIVSAINYMHNENILHRDLKTANIFLTMKGNIKIGDFGISKIINSRNQAQTVLGTPYYFSPEMVSNAKKSL